MAAYYKPLRDDSLAFAKELRYEFLRKQRKEQKHQHNLHCQSQPTYHMEIVIIGEVINDMQVHVKNIMEVHILVVVLVEVHMKDIVQEVMMQVCMVELHMDMVLHIKDMTVVYRKDLVELRHGMIVVYMEDMTVVRRKDLIVLYMVDMIVLYMADMIVLYREDLMVVYMEDVIVVLTKDVATLKVYMVEGYEKGYDLNGQQKLK